jgi:hypothetical protein
VFINESVATFRAERQRFKGFPIILYQEINFLRDECIIYSKKMEWKSGIELMNRCRDISQQ